MKKLLIASAALAMVAGTAQAQSSVQVYGLMDLGYGQTKSSVSGDTNAANNGDVKRTNSGNGVGALSTSRLGFQGSEDLGGGTKANFRLEYGLTDAGVGGNTLAARESWVSLSDAKLGELKLGRQATLSHGIIAGFSAGFANNTAGAIYSPISAATGVNPNPAGVRPHIVFADRAITYVAPKIGNLTVGVSYGKDKTDNTIGTDTMTSTDFTDLSARYTAGKLDLGASYQVVKSKNSAGFTAAQLDTAFGTVASTYNAATAASTATQAETKLTMLGASYNFGVVQPFALYTEKKAETSGSATAAANGTAAKFSATEVGVRAPLSSKVGLFASAYDGDIKYQLGTPSKDDVSGYQVGLTYAMSKRTTAYAITGKAEVEGTGTDTVKGKVTQNAVGIRHTF